MFVNDKRQLLSGSEAFVRVDREWNDGDRVVLRLPMYPRVVRGHDGLVSIYRGPLLFGLHIGEDWRRFKGDEPHADWEVYPTTPWNYGLAVDPDEPGSVNYRGEGSHRYSTFWPGRSPRQAVDSRPQNPLVGLAQQFGWAHLGGPT